MDQLKEMVKTLETKVERMRQEITTLTDKVSIYRNFSYFGFDRDLKRKLFTIRPNKISMSFRLSDERRISKTLNIFVQ